FFVIFLGFNFSVSSNSGFFNSKASETNRPNLSNVNSLVEFSNPTPIIINDGGNDVCTQPGLGNPYPSSINVSGLNGTVTKVTVAIKGFSHTFPSDIGILLVSPNGTKFVLQSDVGGDLAVNNITYTLDDQAAASLPIGGPLTSGTFKPTSLGDDEFFPGSAAAPPYLQPAPAGNATLASAFNGINPNGAWSLFTLDCFAQDTGRINGGWSINITTTAGEPTPTPDANVDMNGDGKTDWVVARATNAPSIEAEKSSGFRLNKRAGSVRERMAKSRETADAQNALPPPIYWYININGTGATSVGALGDSETDFPVPEDYDGDGKDDIAVWRPGPPNEAAFYIFQSSNNTIRKVIFGQTNDDPAIVGDYDGDGKADPAVYRYGADGQNTFFFMGSNNNPNGNITFVPWGSGIVFPNPGDFDGDGKYDFCIQRIRPGTTSEGQFVLLRSSDFGIEYIDWGLESDVILPGDYDGDGRSDFAVRRTIGNQRLHFILERDGGGTGASPIYWGIVDDYSVPGDYDGDGKQDIAVWRADPDPTKNFYYVRRSSDGTLLQFEWGDEFDYPVQNWYVH
ncbi:MAG TPA: VCBS repeat-containing protein, partial [Pyrinomonadaceae bacterium]|nr:VCBS repeat-containing protein [Pyrinomonadaceae bacterium]